MAMVSFYFFIAVNIAFVSWKISIRIKLKKQLKKQHATNAIQQQISSEQNTVNKRNSNTTINSNL